MVDRDDTSAVAQLEKRERFAVKLRKDKKEKLLTAKRRKLIKSNEKSILLQICAEICPELSLIDGRQKVSIYWY